MPVKDRSKSRQASSEKHKLLRQANMKLIWLLVAVVFITFSPGSIAGKFKDSDIPNERSSVTNEGADEDEIADFEAEAEINDAYHLENPNANDYALKKSPWFWRRRRRRRPPISITVHIRHSRRRHG